jgi:hypothetical protein
MISTGLSILTLETREVAWTLPTATLRYSYETLTYR